MKLTEEMLIAVLMGGPGAEREVSIASGRSVMKALEAKGYRVEAVDVVDTEPKLPAGDRFGLQCDSRDFRRRWQIAELS
jgi:D-alanine-D-alanine ligase